MTGTDHAAGRLAVPQYGRDDAAQPQLYYPDYVATRTRAPLRSLVEMPQTLTEVTGPLLGDREVGELDHDLTRQHAGEPLGERIILHGQVVEDGGRPVPRTLVEVWQTNSAGRYRHDVDRHPAPHDPNFTGVGRCLTDDEGRFRFITVKPGAYPWKNHHNAWRPAHIHFSLFGRAFTQRLITQMYFPNDPLFPHDPVMNTVRDEAARERMVCQLDLSEAVPEWALAYRWDIVLRGRGSTVFEDGEDES